MAKVYDHAVIYNGVLIPANTPIEEKAKAKSPKTANDKGGANKNDNATD